MESATQYRIEYLQDRLTLETTEPSFSEMPFRFAEIAKILLDVYVQQTFVTTCALFALKPLIT